MGIEAELESLLGTMNAPRKTGPRTWHPDTDEGLVDKLSEIGAHELLSRPEEVALARQYAENRELVRQLALESMAGVRRFLHLVDREDETLRGDQSFWRSDVSHAQLWQVRHELTLLEDHRRELLRLRARARRLDRTLEVALVSYSACSRAALERIGATDSFVEEVVRYQRQLHAEFSVRQPLTLDVELRTGRARDDILRSLRRRSRADALWSELSLSDASARTLRRKLLTERRAAHEFMQQLGLDADSVHLSHRRTEAALRARDAAKNRFVSANLRLVIWVARRYTGRGMALADLVQEGNLGLLTAVDKFDPDRGYRFSTYATWWIRQAVQRGLANQLRTIRLPVHLHELRRNVENANRQLTQRLGRVPEVHELSNAAGASVKRIEQLRQVERRVRSLDAPLTGQDGSAPQALIDTVADVAYVPPESSLIAHEQSRAIEQLLSILTVRERYIIRQRFGMNESGERDTLQHIADEIGVTRERVRQIESIALERLKKHARLLGLEGLPGFGSKL